MLGSGFSALDALQHGAVRPTPDRVRGDQAGRPRLTRDNLGARFLKPIGYQVGPGRHTPGIEPVERLETGVAKGVAFLAPTQKRRISHDDIRLRPFEFRPVRVHYDVSLLDGVQGLQDRILAAVRRPP